MKTEIKFPESFTQTRQSVIPVAHQWLCQKENGSTISIVGGQDCGLYGDGINTFEMWDYDESEPRGWMTKEEINQYLSNLTNAD